MCEETSERPGRFFQPQLSARLLTAGVGEGKSYESAKIVKSSSQYLSGRRDVNGHGGESEGVIEAGATRSPTLVAGSSWARNNSAIAAGPPHLPLRDPRLNATPSCTHRPLLHPSHPSILAVTLPVQRITTIYISVITQDDFTSPQTKITL